MYLCLFEDDGAEHLWPLAATRGVYDLRLGLRTLLETTREAFGAPSTLLHARRRVARVTAEENDLLVNRIPDGLDVLFVNGRYVAEEGDVLDRLRAAARAGEPARAFVQGGDLVAAWVPSAALSYVEHDAVTRATFEALPEERVEGARLIGRLWHLLDALVPALHRDFAARTAGFNIYERPGARIHESAVLVEAERIYVGEGATVRPGAVLNAEDGPIYIGPDAVVMEHAVIRGPACIGRGSQVKVASNLAESAVGPVCKVAGEVESSVVHSFSNKAHPGFLGNAYLGRWCNLGAGTNTSNLRNDYGEIALYDAATDAYEPTGRQFVGLFMGDHSKCAIDTTFNTGTVVGVFCNLFGPGFPPRHVPSFSWGSPQDGYSHYRIDKALEVAEAVLARRGKTLTEAERELLTAIAEQKEE